MANNNIKKFVSSLDPLTKKLLEHYIDRDYVPKVRTGLGKKNNFYYEHNSNKGILIVKEIIKFKKLQLNSGYITLNSKKIDKFVTKYQNLRYKE